MPGYAEQAREGMRQAHESARARERRVAEGLENATLESITTNAREIMPKRLLNKLDNIPDLDRERQRRLAEMLRDVR